jgi:hypothetical protein
MIFYQNVHKSCALKHVTISPAIKLFHILAGHPTSRGKGVETSFARQQVTQGIGARCKNVGKMYKVFENIYLTKRV